MMLYNTKSTNISTYENQHTKITRYTLTQSTLTLVEVSLRKSVVPKEKETHTYSIHHRNQSIRESHTIK